VSYLFATDANLPTEKAMEAELRVEEKKKKRRSRSGFQRCTMLSD
jgi:hypothetical protein